MRGSAPPPPPHHSASATPPPPHHSASAPPPPPPHSASAPPPPPHHLRLRTTPLQIPCPLPARSFNMTLRTLFFLGLLIVVALCLARATPASYFDDGAYEGESPAPNERDDTGFDDYSENDLENILQVAEKRGCIRRGGNCDYRASDCCVNSACRCNLWGANCRCQRRGIFQKWGK